MQVPDLTPFLAPVIGAATAFILSRGSVLRRSRTAALEDLQLNEKAIGLLDSADPLVDQITAPARNTLQGSAALIGDI